MLSGVMRHCAIRHDTMTHETMTHDILLTNITQPAFFAGGQQAFG